MRPIYAVSISWEANLFHKVSLQEGLKRNKSAQYTQYSTTIQKVFAILLWPLGLNLATPGLFDIISMVSYHTLFEFWCQVQKWQSKRRKLWHCFAKTTYSSDFHRIWINLMFVCFVVSIEFSPVARIAPIQVILFHRRLLLQVLLSRQT